MRRQITDMPFRSAVRLIAGLSVILALCVVAHRVVAPGGEVRTTTDFRAPARYVADPKPNGRLAYDEDDGRALPFTDSPVYLDVAPPGAFEEVDVRIRYRSGDAAVMEIGALASGLDDAYDLRPGHHALVDALEWPRIEGDGFTLLQRRFLYPSVASFLADPPDVSRIAVWHADVDAPVLVPDTVVPTDATISLRGAHTVLLGTDGTPISFRLDLQDMNRQDGADPAHVVVRRDGKEIARAMLSDDGNEFGDQRHSALRDLALSIPDPTPGVYVVEFTTTPDVFIRRLRSSASVAFEGRIYLGDHVGYSDDAPPLTVHATGDVLTARTARGSSLQTIDAGGVNAVLASPNVAVRVRIDAAGEPVPVTVPKRDALLETDGVFLLGEDAAFVARPYRLPWHASSASLVARGVDFVLAPSGLAEEDGNGVRTAEATYRFSDLARTPEGKYRFVVHADGAAEAADPFSVIDARFTFRRDVKGWGEGLRRLISRDVPVDVDDVRLLPDGRSFGEHIP